MVSGNYELVSVRTDELDVPERRIKNELQTWINELDEEKLHCIGAFTASKGSCLTTYVHCRVAGCHRLPLCNGDLLEILSSSSEMWDGFNWYWCWYWSMAGYINQYTSI